MSSIDALNGMPLAEAREAFEKCCGSRRWIEAMLGRRPFASWEEVADSARKVWSGLASEDWKEAFSHHPKIGDIESLRKKFASTASWATGEQGAVREAQPEVLAALAEGNRAYEEKFGYIFIVCATGKSAAEMLAILESRLPNSADAELRIAAGEQMKITLLRLEKLRNESDNHPHP